MNKSFQEALAHRRSIYTLSNSIDVPAKKIHELIEAALMHTPSAFNSQSTRIILLTKENHEELWDLTKGILQTMLPPETFGATEQKLDNCFRSGYGTILFYEDSSVVEGLQQAFPLFADNFPVWAEHTSAMHQLVLWTMLEDIGLGASLQHYNPLIDASVAARWNINPKWRLIAQMPFGKPLQPAAEKTHKPVEERFLAF